MQDHRHGHVVRQVGDQRGRIRRSDPVRVGEREAIGGDAQGVGCDHIQRLVASRRVGAHGGRQQRRQSRVDLHRRDGGHGIDQSEGERAQARTDLQHMVGGTQVGRGDDPAHRIAVVHEVLPEGLGRVQVEHLGQTPHLGRAEQGHRLMIGHTVTFPPFRVASPARQASFTPLILTRPSPWPVPGAVPTPGRHRAETREGPDRTVGPFFTVAVLRIAGGQPAGGPLAA